VTFLHCKQYYLCKGKVFLFHFRSCLVTQSICPSIPLSFKAPFTVSLNQVTEQAHYKEEDPLSFAFATLLTNFKIMVIRWCNKLPTGTNYWLLWFQHFETTIIILRLFNDYNNKTNTFFLHFLFDHYSLKVATLNPTICNNPMFGFVFMFVIHWYIITQIIVWQTTESYTKKNIQAYFNPFWGQNNRDSTILLDNY